MSEATAADELRAKVERDYEKMWAGRLREAELALEAMRERYEFDVNIPLADLREEGATVTDQTSRSAPESRVGCVAEILDACCGGRMWWWDKAHPLAVYMDNRTEAKGANPERPNWHIRPDVLGDFRAMPFADQSFNLVLFDPPHIVRGNPSGIYPLYYGALQPETEQDSIQQGFAECWRVLRAGGTLVFKWAGPLSRVEPHFPSKPIVGNRLVRASSGLGTRWFIFYKPALDEIKSATPNTAAGLFHNPSKVRRPDFPGEDFDHRREFPEDTPDSPAASPVPEEQQP